MLVMTRALFYRDGRNVIALSPELGVSSFGTSVEDAERNLSDAIKLYFETASDQSELSDLLEDAGFTRETPDAAWIAPQLVEQQDLEIEFDE